MTTCRSCGRELSGPICPTCGTPVGESVPWAPIPSSTDSDATRQDWPSDPAGPVDATRTAAWIDQTRQAAPTPEPTWTPTQPAQRVQQPQGGWTPGYPQQAPQGGWVPVQQPVQQAQEAQGGWAPGYPQQPAQGGWAPGYPQQTPQGGWTPGPTTLPQVQPVIAWTPPAEEKRRGWLIPVVASLAALALIAAGAVLVQRFVLAPSTLASPGPVVTVTSTSTAPASTTAPATTTTAPQAPASTSQPPALSPDAQALADLQATATAAQPQLDAAVARHAWVAQLASKYVGISDPLQTTASGSHTFGAADILAEYRTMVASSNGSSVILADSRTFGQRKTMNGQPYWRTMALNPSFTSAATVKAWCASTFPALTGETLTNQCMPVQL